MRNSGGGFFAELYSAWPTQRSAGNTDIFLGYGGTTISATAASAGFVLREQGINIPAADSTMKLKTRRMYLASMGNEFRLDRLFTYVATGQTTQDIILTPYSTLTNDGSGAAGIGAQTRSWNGESMFSLSYSALCEGLELQLEQASNNQGHFGPQLFIIDWTDYGIEDSGKS
jgi:hypothetical protein